MALFVVMPALRPNVRLILVYGLLSLATVALGCFVCARWDVPAGSWSRNLIAWGVGLAGAAALAAWAGPRCGIVVLGLAVLAVGASLAGVPQDGVHRWLDLGPLHVNAAFVVLPMAVVALSWNVERLWCWALALVIQGMLVLQPDASQAAAFGCGLMVIALRSSQPRGVRIGFVLAVIVLAVAAWLRPDPLKGVPEVEEILGLAYFLSPIAGVLAALLIFATLMVPTLTVQRSPAVQTTGAALSAYLLASAAVTMFGAYPMPLLGVGMSPVLGFWLGVGLLAACLRREAGRAPTPGSGS